MKADDCKICCLTLDSSQTECVLNSFFFFKLIKEKSWEKNLQNSHNTVFGWRLWCISVCCMCSTLYWHANSSQMGSSHQCHSRQMLIPFLNLDILDSFPHMTPPKSFLRAASWSVVKTKAGFGSWICHLRHYCFSHIFAKINMRQV